MRRGPKARAICSQRGVAVAICVAEALVCARVQAEVPLELSYEAPAGCGSAAEIRRQVERAVAENTAGTTPERPMPALTARIVVSAAGDRYTLALDATRDGQKVTRTLQLDSCPAVTEASALLLLLALDPALGHQLGAPEDDGIASSMPENTSERPPENTETQARAKEPTPEAAPSSSSEAKPKGIAEDERPPSAPQKPAGWDVAGQLSLGARAVHGVAPDWAIGPVLSAGLWFGGFGALGSASWNHGWESPLPGVQGASIRSDLLHVDLAGAYRFGTREVSAAPFLGLGTDLMSANVVGVTRPGGAHTEWASLRGGLLLNLLISGPWALDAELGLVRPLKRPAFSVAGVTGVAHQAEPFGVEAGLGISWRWGSQK
ncbi:MAG TPA: hypothetical protein VHM70_04600 [Polyangiaceae bacterium]|nr:hypothetical protein [Polyangiaceae bacterium]